MMKTRFFAAPRRGGRDAENSTDRKIFVMFQCVTAMKI